MTPQRQRSREVIRNEMIREVARLWNSDESDMAIESFDPLVGMLLGAFATGIEGLHHELSNSRSRIVERLAQLLTPEVMTGPQPAHAVMHTHIVDPSFDVEPKHVFSCNAGGRDFQFSPAGSFKLFNAKIRTLVVQNKVKEYGPSIKDSFLNQILPANACWLGLVIDKELDSFQDLSLFFDWRNDPLRSSHLEQLADVRFFLENTELKSTPGFPEDDQWKRFLNEDRISDRLHETVQKYYSRHFLNVSSFEKKTGQPIDLADCRKKCPQEIGAGLTVEESAKFFSQELVWIKVVFPERLAAETTYRTHIEVNSFPVVNRKLATDHHELRPLFNIFPIRVEANESFLEMAEVETPRAVQLQSVQQLSADGQNQYVLRQGGITRFDERDGYEIVTYLISLLRDESAMFMALGRTELETEIEEIRKRLEKINAAVGAERGQNSFLAVKTIEKTGRLTIRFWSTKAELANKIPFGMKLTKDRSNLAFTDDETVLLTTTTGGKKKLLPNENLPVFRQALLTRGRIVTVEDIKAVCFAEMGDKIRSVQVTKGVALGAQKSQGLVRTIDVVLTPNPANYSTDEQWDDHCYRLKQLIEQQSFNLLPYRVMKKN